MASPKRRGPASTTARACPDATIISSYPTGTSYVEGGKRYDLTVPPGTKRVNRVEIRGAAYGTATTGPMAQRPARSPPGRKGVSAQCRTSFAPRNWRHAVLHQHRCRNSRSKKSGLMTSAQAHGTHRQLQALLHDQGRRRTRSSPRLPPLNAFIAGRFAPGRALHRRSRMPSRGREGGRSAPVPPVPAGDPVQPRGARDAPIVHILIPVELRRCRCPTSPLARAWDYGWQNLT